MVRRILTVALALGVGGVGLAGCGFVSAGPTATENRDVPAGATGVRVEGTGDVTFQPGDPALAVTAGRNTLERIETEERAGVLALDVDGGFLNSPGPIDYELSLPELDAVEIAGSGSVSGVVAPADQLTVHIDGSGDIDLTEIDADEVRVVISGSGSVELEGTAEHLDVLIEGSGEFHGDRLEATTAATAIEGSGDIEVHATDTLDASISGSGTTRHTGGAEVTEHIDGGGEIVAD
ncbi:head GIN domain-containing protein [Ruania zhangjianzhongii]|uniref:head GIN domain-containing protein n=1 Tax=Ruania zhangjianzhongii TaxID=2603206 RepID=UPI00143CD904|nr:head GIN domain-containing protein [Ruania zhangjianzhongii]